jgi:hypothetical protein
MHHAYRVIAILCLFSVSASAKEFLINDQDQSNIQGICDVAAASPALNRDVRANVSAWCVAWEKRVTDAAKEAAKPADK